MILKLVLNEEKDELKVKIIKPKKENLKNLRKRNKKKNNLKKAFFI